MEEDNESSKKEETNNFADRVMRDEFKYDYKDETENNDEYEKALEKDIETNCEFKEYVDKLELEDLNDEELSKMENFEIINVKNYQIQKLKSYVYSLEKEKEDLIENFKNTTNVLLDRIKELEFSETGVRPQTGYIVRDIEQRKNQKMNETQRRANESRSNDMAQRTNRGDKSSDRIKSNTQMLDFTENSGKKQRCPNCTKEFEEAHFLKHSLECLRNYIRCKVCSQLIHENDKKEHLNSWRVKEVN